jgi:hypothetical protein
LLAVAGPAAADLADEAAQAAFDGLIRLCSEDDDAGGTVGFFRIIYASCRMTMYQGDAVVDMRLPPGTNQAFFDLIDYEGRHVVTQPVDVAAILTNTTEQGRSGGSINATGESQLYVTSALEEETDEFTFNSSFVMDFGGMLSAFGGAGGDQVTPQQLAMLDQIMGTPIITSTGSAWIAPNAPGADTVRAFYENFAAVLQSGQGSTALMSGLFNHFLLREGLPLEMTQTTSVEMGSLAAGLPGAIGASVMPMPAAQTTTTTIERILVRPIPNGYCGSSIVPDGFTVVDPLAGLGSGGAGSQGAGQPAAGGASASGASGSFPGGAGNPDADEAAAAVGEINAAMANMTDEQKAAMQQIGAGFGALLGGALSGQGAAASTGAQAPSSTAPAAPTRAATGPSSAELMTNDLTESVQNLLRALGYDPGPSDGELSTETMIAISQFQAEQGLDVTGEVTPQLVGILAAQVDER